MKVLKKILYLSICLSLTLQIGHLSIMTISAKEMDARYTATVKENFTDDVKALKKIKKRLYLLIML